MINLVNEWTAAQELLVLLAQTLSVKPLEDNGMPLQFERNVGFIAKQIFKKPFAPSTGPLPHAVCLLPTLQVAREKMTHWIAVFDCPEDTSSLRGGKPPEKPQTMQEGKKFLPSNLVEAPKPLAKAIEKERCQSSQTKKLIKEVRVAIQTLSTSSFLSAPQPAPLRAALEKLKPLVDEFIETLSKNNLDPRPESAKQHSIFSKPIVKESSKSVLPHTQKEEGGVPQKTGLAITILNDPPVLPKMKTIDNQISSPSLPTPQPVIVQEKDLDRSPVFIASIAKPEKEKERASNQRPPLPIALPIAISSPNRLSLVATKKKKRKRYFFQEQSADDSSLDR